MRAPILESADLLPWVSKSGRCIPVDGVSFKELRTSIGRNQSTGVPRVAVERRRDPGTALTP